MARVATRAFVKDRAAFKARCAEENALCWLCGMNHIDYEAPYDDYKNDDCFELDHFYPVSTHPELQQDPTHLRPAAAGCNNEHSSGSPRPPPGTLSRNSKEHTRKQPPVPTVVATEHADADTTEEPKPAPRRRSKAKTEPKD